LSQPVKVSDALLLDARIAGEAVERSIAGQIECWAKIGRTLEPILREDHVPALCRPATLSRSPSVSPRLILPPTGNG
jgi:hypothetical protein